MSLFKPLPIIHFICGLVLTFSISTIWNLSFEPHPKFHLRQICKPLTGCRILDIPTMVDCTNMTLSCLGPKRCCHDCTFLYYSTHKSITTMNKSIKYHIRFSDDFRHPIIVCVCGACCILFLHILLLVLMFYRKQQHSSKQLKENEGNKYYSTKILPVLTPIIFVAIFFISVGFSLYSVGFLCVHINSLLKCQPVGIILASWCWILSLWVLEYITNITPYVEKKKSAEKDSNCNSHIVYKLFQLCFLPFSTIVCVLNVVGLLWWAIISVYLVGVSLNKWVL